MAHSISWKRDLATKMRTHNELVAGVSVFDTAWWRLRKDRAWQRQLAQRGMDRTTLYHRAVERAKVEWASYWWGKKAYRLVRVWIKKMFGI